MWLVLKKRGGAEVKKRGGASKEKKRGWLSKERSSFWNEAFWRLGAWGVRGGWEAW